MAPELKVREARWTRPFWVAVWFAAVAVVMTWPLITVMHRRIGGDVGDSLFNSWVLLWTGGQVLRALHGDFSALAQYWNGNIFYPSTLTLAYSEHLTPQMLQILPVLAVTNNIILCYNLLLLGTIVLSGLGMYLLVRELTGHPVAALLAGLAFAFAPFRIDQFVHLEVLSSQWMPFTLYGFRRYFVTGRVRPLLGGAAALLVQGLSCGYYLAFFTPFAVAYCLYELIARGRLRDWRAWRHLIATGGAVLLIIGVLLAPYARVRQSDDVGVRPRREILHLSADTHAYGTIASDAALWGRWIRAWPYEEEQGFPGFAGLAFAAIAIGGAATEAWSRSRPASSPRAAGWRRGAALIIGVALIVQCGLLVWLLIAGPSTFTVAGVGVSTRNVNSALIRLAFTLAALLLVSPRCREAARAAAKSPMAFFVIATIVAAWLSLGPVMHAHGREIGTGPYEVLYRWVPGFNGLRVVSLLFMLVACFLSVLAGFGAARLGASRAATFVALAGMVAILAEGRRVPADMPVPAPTETVGLRLQLRPVYQIIRDLPKGTVVVEFPFGVVGDEIRYTYAAGYHRQPIVNGYSGFFPAPYRQLAFSLSDPMASRDAWPMLLASGATHAIVHEASYAGDGGPALSAWIQSRGAREVAAFEGDRVFELRHQN